VVSKLFDSVSRISEDYYTDKKPQCNSFFQKNTVLYFLYSKEWQKRDYKVFWVYLSFPCTRSVDNR